MKGTVPNPEPFQFLLWQPEVISSLIKDFVKMLLQEGESSSTSLMTAWEAGKADSTYGGLEVVLNPAHKTSAEVLGNCSKLDISLIAIHSWLMEIDYNRLTLSHYENCKAKDVRTPKGFVHGGGSRGFKEGAFNLFSFSFS